MKTILIFPPQWTPLNPYFSLASLIGQLRSNGFDTEIRDLNVEYYNYVLTRDYVKKSLDRALEMHKELFEDLAKEYTDDKAEDDYSIEFKRKLYKYTKIKEYKNTKLQFGQTIPDIIEDAVAAMKDPERFYNPEELIKALNNIDAALEIISMPYYPTSLEFHHYSDQFFKLTMESFKEYCLNRELNMFYDFYETVLPSIIDRKPDLIALSINSSSQMIGGLTIAMMLKKNTNAHISIGGNFFGRVVEALVNNPEFFELFVDSVIYEEGEKPVVELAKYVDGQISIDQVPNLVHLQDGIVKVNDKAVPMKLNEIHFQDLAGYPLELYMTPDIVLSIQSSRGCYWQKCSFCDHFFGQNINVKDIDRLVEEIKTMQSKFGIRHFEFIDESISPSYLHLMSERFIKEGLDLHWFNDARLETEFTKDLLELASQAGLRMVLWGFESGSERIMELINKGIDYTRRLSILRDSFSAGIWNFVFIFFGFPTETQEDAEKTIQTICENTDVISSYGRSVFTLGKHTRLRDDPEKFSITEILDNKEEFSPSYEFRTSTGMMPHEINKMANLCTEKCNEAYDGPLWMYLRYREVLFLYVSKFGAHEVHNCKVC